MREAVNVVVDDVRLAPVVLHAGHVNLQEVLLVHVLVPRVEVRNGRLRRVHAVDLAEEEVLVVAGRVAGSLHGPSLSCDTMLVEVSGRGCLGFLSRVLGVVDGARVRSVFGTLGEGVVLYYLYVRELLLPNISKELP